MKRNLLPCNDMKIMTWGIETSFRDFKHTIGLAYFHSKRVEFIKREIYAGRVLYNFCEAITSHIVVQNKHRKHTYQLHFSAARMTEDKTSSGAKHPSVA